MSLDGKEERPGYGSIGKSGFAMTPSEREKERIAWRMKSLRVWNIRWLVAAPLLTGFGAALSALRSALSGAHSF